MKYKKGDLVIVRDWDDMCEEHPHSKNNISTGTYTFIKRMAKYCNKLFKIVGVYGSYYYLSMNDSRFMFTDEMLLPYNDKQFDNYVINTYYTSNGTTNTAYTNASQGISFIPSYDTIWGYDSSTTTNTHLH